MAFYSFIPFLKTSSLTLTILSTLLFFLLKSPPPPPSPPHKTPRRSLLPAPYCSSDGNHSSNGLINYFSLHSCFFSQNSLLSISFLTLLSVLFFYILIKTAQSHFSLVTTKLSTLLNLSPSMAAVTLLALGNGSPDIFSSVVALRNGEYRTGFGAILSAGAFVSALVVGFVAIYAAPFSVDPGCFVRDVGFYLVAAMFLFYVYLSGEIFLWQAVGFVGFYAFFVGIVFWMDLGMNRSEKKGQMEMSYLGPDCEVGGEVKDFERKRDGRIGFAQVYGKVCVWITFVFLLNRIGLVAECCS